MSRNIKALKEYLKNYTDENDKPAFKVNFNANEDIVWIKFTKDNKPALYYASTSWGYDSITTIGEDVRVDFVIECYQALISEESDKNDC